MKLGWRGSEGAFFTKFHYFVIFSSRPSSNHQRAKPLGVHQRLPDGVRCLDARLRRKPSISRKLRRPPRPNCPQARSRVAGLNRRVSGHDRRVVGLTGRVFGQKKFSTAGNRTEFCYKLNLKKSL